MKGIRGHPFLTSSCTPLSRVSASYLTLLSYIASGIRSGPCTYLHIWLYPVLTKLSCPHTPPPHSGTRCTYIHTVCIQEYAYTLYTGSAHTAPCVHTCTLYTGTYCAYNLYTGQSNSIHLSTYRSIYLRRNIYLSIHPSIHLSVYQRNVRRSMYSICL